MSAGCWWPRGASAPTTTLGRRVCLPTLTASLACLGLARIAGISRKTQELYLLVFVCRYLDLFYSYISL